LPGGFQYSITDLVGNEIYSGVSYKNSISVSIENFPDGIYNISIRNNTKILSSKKLLIRH